MTKDELLKSIAETGYNVGFGAKKALCYLRYCRENARIN